MGSFHLSLQDYSASASTMLYVKEADLYQLYQLSHNLWLLDGWAKGDQ